MSPKKKQVKPIKRENREKKRMTKSKKGEKKNKKRKEGFWKGQDLRSTSTEEGILRGAHSSPEQWHKDLGKINHYKLAIQVIRITAWNISVIFVLKYGLLRFRLVNLREQ